MKTKNKQARNPVVKNMIQRSQNAGYHLDIKKEQDRRACRDNIDDLIDEWHESDNDIPIYEYLGLTQEEYSRYVSNNKLPGE